MTKRSEEAYRKRKTGGWAPAQQCSRCVVWDEKKITLFKENGDQTDGTLHRASELRVFFMGLSSEGSSSSSSPARPLPSLDQQLLWHFIIHLLQWIHCHLNKASTVRIIFSYFSSAFNTILPALPRKNLQKTQVNASTISMRTCHLTNWPQCETKGLCVWTGGQQHRSTTGDSAF